MQTLPLNKILQGHALDKLKQLPDNSVDCVITSPPYWGLRNYKTAPVTFKASNFSLFGFKRAFKKWTGHYGLEPTPEMFVAHTVLIFNEVYRVLKPQGTLWLNFGDSYATGSKNRTEEQSVKKSTLGGGKETNKQSCQQQNKITSGLKNKDLAGIPWMVAFALRQAGWYLRQDIIWHKPNPMPESVTDRCTKAHEYIFLLSKSQKYYFDAEAIKSPGKNPIDDFRRIASVTDTHKSFPDAGKNGLRKINIPTGWDTDKGSHGNIHKNGRSEAKYQEKEFIGASKRSVWTIATQAFPEAHFATYPEDLIVDMIKAGSSQYGCCLVCGLPFIRQTRSQLIATKKASFRTKPDERDMKSKTDQGSNRVKDGHIPGLIHKTETESWVQSCKCKNCITTPATILDPFAGAATTLLVAAKLGRNAIGIELNQTYINDIALPRLQRELGMFNQFEKTV